MPPPAKPTTREEDIFMKALLNDLDGHFLQFNATPCDTTPAKNATRHSAKPTENPFHDALVNKPSASIAEQSEAGGLMSLPSGQSNKTVDIKDVDMDALCDGADDWDWQDDIDDSVNPPPACLSSIFSEFGQLTCLQRSLDPPSPSPSLVREKCTRCEVLEVSTPHFSTKVLTLPVPAPVPVSDLRSVL